MSDTPFTDLVHELWAREVRDHLDAKHHRETAHQVHMATAMWFNERLLGVPYGPALCEVRPSKLRGLMITGDPRNRAERRKRR